MSNPLNSLVDADLDAIRHLIRKDALKDLAIAQEAELRGAEGLPEGDRAKAMVIWRYRKSAAYKAWLKRWENQDADLKKAIALQQQRFEFLSALVRDPDAKGIEAVSKSLQARLLTLAAEASDEDLREGAGKGGWIKNVIKVIQDEAKMERQATGEKAAEVAQDSKLTPEERAGRIKEIFGIA